MTQVVGIVIPDREGLGYRLSGEEADSETGISMQKFILEHPTLMVEWKQHRENLGSDVFTIKSLTKPSGYSA